MFMVHVVFQNLLESLRYTYVTSGEELPGLREVRITASDGVFTAYTVLIVNVTIANDNAPTLSLQGRETATFVEGATSPAPIGKDGMIAVFY